MTDAEVAWIIKRLDGQADNYQVIHLTAKEWATVRARLVQEGLAVPAWQDISTAPKDGIDIIYLNKFREIGFAHWSEARTSDEVSCWWDAEKDDEVVPRYWLPRSALPAAPARAEGA